MILNLLAKEFYVQIFTVSEAINLSGRNISCRGDFDFFFFFLNEKAINIKYTVKTHNSQPVKLYLSMYILLNV